MRQTIFQTPLSLLIICELEPTYNYIYFSCQNEIAIIDCLFLDMISTRVNFHCLSSTLLPYKLQFATFNQYYSTLVILKSRNLIPLIDGLLSQNTGKLGFLHQCHISENRLGYTIIYMFLMLLSALVQNGVVYRLWNFVESGLFSSSDCLVATYIMKK